MAAFAPWIAAARRLKPGRSLFRVVVFLCTPCFAAFGNDSWRIELHPKNDSSGYIAIAAEGYRSIDEAIANFPVKTHYAALSHIWMALYFSRDAQSQAEIHAYLKAHYPSELSSALKSAGNTHNPRVTPLKKPFEEAVLSTSLARSVNAELSKIGYKITRVSSEKFHIDKNTSTFWAAVWLITSKVEPAAVTP